jgi:hypothetical protein
MEVRFLALDKQRVSVYAEGNHSHTPVSMSVPHSPIATISHSAFQALLARQPWPFWAIDTPDLEPLLPYQPVSLTKLVRMLKSHFTYSDRYLFNPSSQEDEVTAVIWGQLPHVDTETIEPYIISRTVGHPFLGFATSRDAAQHAQIIMLLLADDETLLTYLS